MLSKTFRSLLESMKSSYNEMDEDKDARVERREERRRERREDKFGVSTSTTDGTTTEVAGSSDFKIRPFMRAVQQLKSQVQSEIFNTNQILDSRGAGYQSARTYESKFNTILEIIEKIESKMDSIKDKEGRNLEDKDTADIKILRDLYSTASNDFIAAKKEWTEKKLEDETKYLSDLKDTETNNLIREATKAFTEAQAMLDELTRISQAQVGGMKATGGANLETGDVIKAGKKYTNDSKEGKIVIEVKKTIYKKFKSKLGTKKDWEIVYKSGVDNVSGSLLGNTQALIVMIKGGLFKTGKYPQFESDKGGDITPAFIQSINSLTESQSNSFGKLITFENFIKSKVNEDFEFDMEGADQALNDFRKSSGSSNNQGSNNADKPKIKIPEYSATPFKNDTEGNKFRAWVIKNKAEWAKTNNLDATGAKDNTYVRKAYQEFGAEYKKSADVSSVVKKDVLTNAQLDVIKKKIESYGAKAEIKLTVADKQPCILFWSGKQYAVFYNTRKVTYTTSAGKHFSGLYDSKTNNVTFAKHKAWDLKYVAKFTISDRLASEKSETAQSKKAYVAKSGDGYVNVRSTIDTSENANNIIIKFTDKSKQIGVVVSSSIQDSTKLGKKTWYKVQFPTPIQPNKNGSNTYEYGWVRSDTVDLK